MIEISERNNELGILWRTKRYRLYSFIAFIVALILIFFVRSISTDPDAVLAVGGICLFISAVTFFLYFSKETIFYKDGSVVIITRRFFGSKKEEFELKKIDSIELDAKDSSEAISVGSKTYNFDINLKIKSDKKVKIGTVVLPINNFSTSGVYPPTELGDPSLTLIFDFTGLPLEVSLRRGLFTPIPENIYGPVRDLWAHRGDLRYHYVPDVKITLEAKNAFEYSTLSIVIPFLLLIILSIVFGVIIFMNLFYLIENPDNFKWLISFFLLFGGVIFTLGFKFFPALKTKIVVDRSKGFLEKIDVGKKETLYRVPTDQIVAVNIWKRLEKSTRYKDGSITHLYTIEKEDGEEVLLAYVQLIKQKPLSIFPVFSDVAGQDQNDTDAAIVQMSNFLGVPLKVKN